MYMWLCTYKKNTTLSKIFNLSSLIAFLKFFSAFFKAGIFLGHYSYFLKHLSPFLNYNWVIQITTCSKYKFYMKFSKYSTMKYDIKYGWPFKNVEI